jgi:formate dehydrogenase iron-sulfur subunit
MTLRIFIPRDAGAVAVGADEVAAALEHAAANRGVTIEIVRTGSRGLYWLEHMVEVSTPQGRVAFGPVRDTDAAPCSPRSSAMARMPCGLASPTRFPG